MYNRYIRNDSGTYSRIPQEEPHVQQNTGKQAGQQPQHKPPPKPDPPRPDPPPPCGDPPPCSPPFGERKDGLTGFLRHFLDQFHLDHVDTGDLLLLGLLFFLFREDADEELLVALGLLLIL